MNILRSRIRQWNSITSYGAFTLTNCISVTSTQFYTSHFYGAFTLTKTETETKTETGTKTDKMGLKPIDIGQCICLGPHNPIQPILRRSWSHSRSRSRPLSGWTHPYWFQSLLVWTRFYRDIYITYLTDERLTGYKRCLCICVSLLLALILLGGVIILVVLLVVIGGQPPRVTTNWGQIEGEFDVLNNVFKYKVIGSSFTLALILRMIWIEIADAISVDD